MPRESLLVATLVELADNLVDTYDVIEILTMLSHRCIEVVNAAAAGVMLAHPEGGLQFVASSGEAMRLLELFQIQSNEGPSLDCFASGAPITNLFLSGAQQRWPAFTPRALAQGFHLVHCLPMRLRGRTIGVLNLFGSGTEGLGEDDVVAAQGLADIATIAILQHRTSLDARVLNDQLGIALQSRIIIEQAKGMVCQAVQCDMDIAFARLRAHSRNHNQSLTEVATAVVEGTLLVSRLDHGALEHSR